MALPDFVESSDFIEPSDFIELSDFIEPLVEDFLCFIVFVPFFCMLFDDIEPFVFVVVCWSLPVAGVDCCDDVVGVD